VRPLLSIYFPALSFVAMHNAEDASSALPPMDPDSDDLDDAPENDAVAFAVAAVQHGEDMLDDDEVLHESHHHGLTMTSQNHNSDETGVLNQSQATPAPTTSTFNSLSELISNSRLVSTQQQQSLTKPRTRRVGRINQMRHDDLMHATASADDSDQAAIIMAGVIHSKHGIYTVYIESCLSIVLYFKLMHSLVFILIDEKWNEMFQKLVE
jgi:hypothetical protein